MTELNRPFPSPGLARIRSRIPCRCEAVLGPLCLSLSVSARERAFVVPRRRRHRRRGGAPSHRRRRRRGKRSLILIRSSGHSTRPRSVLIRLLLLLLMTRRRPDEFEPVLRDVRLEVLRRVSHHRSSRCSMWSVRACVCVCVYAPPSPSLSRLTPEREREGRRTRRGVREMSIYERPSPLSSLRPSSDKPDGTLKEISAIHWSCSVRSDASQEQRGGRREDGSMLLSFACTWPPFFS